MNFVKNMMKGSTSNTKIRKSKFRVSISFFRKLFHMDSLQEDTINDLKSLFEEFVNVSGSSKHNFENAAKEISGDANTNDKTVLENKLTIILNKLNDILEKINKNSVDYFKVLSMKVSVLYENSKICFSVNAVDQAKEYLESGLNLIKEYEEHPQIAFLYLRMINYLCYILSRGGELEKAKELLEKCTLQNLKCQPKVYCTADLFFNNDIDQSVGEYKINKLLTNNMQMLSWIYGKLGLSDQYATMIHKTLQKELDINEGDPCEWVDKCLRLVSLFLSQSKWENARYYLTAAQVVLDPLEVNFSPNDSLFKAQADLAKNWINYGLHLFSSSNKSILEKIWDESKDIAQENSVKEEPKNNIREFVFTGLEINAPNVPVKKITNLEEAKLLFFHTHQWLKRARFYYSLRDYPVEYVRIVLELGELYGYLSFYEKTVDEQYNVQKKRYETLETLNSIVKEVRPRHYVSVSIEIIKGIIDVQLELMNLNLKKLYNPSIQTTGLENEDDLQKRIFTVAEIESKIEKLAKVSYTTNQIRLGEEIREIETNITELEDSKIENIPSCPQVNVSESSVEKKKLCEEI